MLKPTNDPIQVYRREQATASRETREALAAGGTQPAQVLRKVQAQVAEIRELFIRMPFNDGAQRDTSGWTLNNFEHWSTLVSATINRPANKSRAIVSVSASVSALAPATEWGATAFETRLVINGAASGIITGVMEAPGAQVQQCAAFPSFVRELPGLGGNVVVELQARGGPYTALPAANRASLSVTAGFSVV